MTSLSQEITIEKIWKNYEFYPKYAPSINALSDGVSCVLRTNDNAIIKYKIADMEKEKPLKILKLYLRLLKDLNMVLLSLMQMNLKFYF